MGSIRILIYVEGLARACLHIACRSGTQGLLRNLFQGSDRSIISRKSAERIECRIDVIRRMIGADLEADFLIALRHHGVVQTGSEDVMTAQMSYQRRGACSVAQQQWHDRVLAG